MNVNEIRQAAVTLTAAASLLWLGGAQSQQFNCESLGSGWQAIEVSGQSSGAYSATGGAGTGCDLAPCAGDILVCFNPDQNCYVAAASGTLASRIPFTANPVGSELAIASVPECGSEKNSMEKSFNVRLASTDPGSGCLNRLIVKEGSFGSGRLVGDEKGPAVLIESNPPVLVDQFVNEKSLEIPGFHRNLSFKVQVPLMDGMGGMGGMAGAITVRNQTTGQLIGGGSVNNSCGARLVAPPVIPIPTLPQYGMLLLTLGLILAAVGLTRRRMGV